MENLEKEAVHKVIQQYIDGTYPAFKGAKGVFSSKCLYERLSQ